MSNPTCSRCQFTTSADFVVRPDGQCVETARPCCACCGYELRSGVRADPHAGLATAGKGPLGIAALLLYAIVRMVMGL